MKRISVLIPCYNEVENVQPISEMINRLFITELSEYDYEIIFIDNHSTDGTREKLRDICVQNTKIKAIFNARNFGQGNSPYYGMMQTTGECTITLCCDFQDPVELIPVFVKKWEEGNLIVCGIKEQTKENMLMYFIRTCYYKLIRKISNVEIIEHFTGYGLYDQKFINILSQLKDPIPFLRGIVAELGYKTVCVPYEQQKRRSGKTHNNFFSLYDYAMLSFTSYSKVGLRLCTLLGIMFGCMSILVGFVYLFIKLLFWYNFEAGMAPIVIGMFFLGGIQLFFLGMLGEYVLSINQRVMNRPLVIEEERINFEKKDLFEEQ